MCVWGWGGFFFFFLHNPACPSLRTLRQEDRLRYKACLGYQTLWLLHLPSLPLTSPPLQALGSPRLPVPRHLSQAQRESLWLHSQLHPGIGKARRQGLPPGHIASSDFCMASLRSKSLLPTRHLQTLARMTVRSSCDIRTAYK